MPTGHGFSISAPKYALYHREHYISQFNSLENRTSLHTHLASYGEFIMLSLRASRPAICTSIMVSVFASIQDFLKCIIDYVNN